MTSERVIGVDYGDVRIGIALSDPTRTLASPLTTIPRNNKAVKTILRLISENEVSKMVIGYPYTLKGEAGSAVEKVENFIRGFAGANIEIVRWDERFTTSTALDLLVQSGKRRSKDKGIVDRSAAAVLLQDYLDLNKTA